MHITKVNAKEWGIPDYFLFIALSTHLRFSKIGVLKYHRRNLIKIYPSIGVIRAQIYEISLCKSLTLLVVKGVYTPFSRTFQKLVYTTLLAQQKFVSEGFI